MKILCVAAHPDDETLGCGATLRKHSQQGDEVSLIVLGTGVGSREGKESVEDRMAMLATAGKKIGIGPYEVHDYPDNSFDMVPILDITKDIEHMIADFKPEVVYTHHAWDLNIDHRVVHQATMVACRPQPGQSVRQVFCYEVPCSTGWSGNFHPTYFVNVEHSFAAKLEACRCYADEMREWPHPRSYEHLSTLAHMRGATVGMKFAEAFEVQRICT